MSRRSARSGVVLVALAAAVGLSGCSAASEGTVTQRADAFYESLRHGDGAAACAVLAEEAKESLEEQEGEPCGTAILGQGLPESSEGGTAVVYGSMAQVRYAGETAFLSRFSDGWRITAVGCAPTEGEGPHTCLIEVG